MSSFGPEFCEYLSEGDVGNVLEDLVDQAQVNLSDWIRQWDQIRSRSDAAEWRASSARLLASYPDHPGLLLSRGLSELLATAEGRQQTQRSMSMF